MRESRITLILLAVVLILVFSTSYADDRGAAHPSEDPDPFSSFTISANTELVKPEFVDLQILDGLSADQKRTLQSIRLIRDTTTYFMKFYGSYVPEGFVLDSPFDMQDQPGRRISCTTFSAATPSGDPIFAYNNDNAGPDWMMVIFTNPPDGFASLCITSTRFCGIRQYALDYHDLGLRDFVLTSPHYSFDGINEYGVTMSPMNNGNAVQVYDPAKESLHGLTTIRLVLHAARDVHEAIALMRRFNNTFSDQIHYLLSDAHGNSAVVEYYGDGVTVTWKSGPFQVCTNNRVNGFQNDALHWATTCNRYYSLLLVLGECNGVVSEERAFELLHAVAPYPTAASSSVRTVWSSVYNNVSGEWRLCLDREYDQVYRFSLPMVTDMSISDLRLLAKPENIRPGATARILAEVANNSVRPSKATRIEFYLSKKSKIANKSILLKSCDLEAISAGKTVKVRTTISLPSDIKPGSYSIIALLDSRETNIDDNRDNNVVVIKQRVGS